MICLGRGFTPDVLAPGAVGVPNDDLALADAGSTLLLVGSARADVSNNLHWLANQVFEFVPHLKALG